MDTIWECKKYKYTWIAQNLFLPKTQSRGRGSAIFYFKFKHLDFRQMSVEYMPLSPMCWPFNKWKVVVHNNWSVLIYIFLRNVIVVQFKLLMSSYYKSYCLYLKNYWLKQGNKYKITKSCLFSEISIKWYEIKFHKYFLNIEKVLGFIYKDST